MWLRSSSISFDGHRSKIWKVSRRRPVASNETILAIKQVFFFTKVAPIQSITDIVLLDFWSMVVSWMFIYPTLPFIFRKEIYFSNVYISVSTIFECLCMLFDWERGHQLSIHATGEEDWGGSFKMLTSGYKKRECHTLCVRMHFTYTISFYVFGSIFFIVSWFICGNSTLPLLKKDVFIRNGYFSLTISISVVMK